MKPNQTTHCCEELQSLACFRNNMCGVGFLMEIGVSVGESEISSGSYLQNVVQIKPRKRILSHRILFTLIFVFSGSNLGQNVLNFFLHALIKLRKISFRKIRSLFTDLIAFFS